MTVAPTLARQETFFRDSNHAPLMVALPAGTFRMGADVEADKFASIVELPRHVVTLSSPIAMAQHPVTQQQWGVYRSSSCAPGEEDLPVTNVSWQDAAAYCRWLSDLTGRPYRLPSEAEWEYGCRAGSNDTFATGHTIGLNEANFLYMDFGGKPGLGRLTAVGSYPANRFGLHDMHGNVAELVADTWYDGYVNAPLDGAARSGAADALRVVRGGGWDALPRLLRCAFRDAVDPRAHFDNVGFRVALTL